MDLLRGNNEYRIELLESELEVKGKECQTCLATLSREMRLLETWKTKLTSGKADDKLCQQIPVKLRTIKSLFEEVESKLAQLAEDKADEAPKEKKKRRELLQNLKDQIAKSNTRYQDLSKELITALQKPSTKQRQPQHRVSGDIHVYEMQDIEPGQQVVGEYTDAVYFTEILAQRQQDINNIDALMGTIQDIAQQIATVVERQDEMVQQIGENARRTRENAKGALREIAEANDARGSANSKMLFLLFCIIVVILFIAVLLSIYSNACLLLKCNKISCF